jgi:hypothetical protein
MDQEDKGKTITVRYPDTPEGKEITLTACSQSKYNTEELQLIETALNDLSGVVTDISDLIGQEGEQLNSVDNSVKKANEEIAEGTIKLGTSLEHTKSKASTIMPVIIGVGVGTAVAGPIGFFLSANAGIGLLCLAAGGGLGIGGSMLFQGVKDRLPF